ncbi:MAG: D-glycero-D-manno-heptose 1,7-bisphosphate phosphatase [Planctomycetota bacterium]|jgi:D-glycero-D-manno-heptose 1,7-bisphosphate phosphatase
MSSGSRAAVFLDRDGTINEEVDYLSRPEDFKLISGAAAGMRELASSGYALVVVTNQSGIARGMFSEQRLEEIHARMIELLRAEQVELDDIEYCPHHPDEDDDRYGVVCECGKSKSGLLQQAQQVLDIDLSRSWIVGDSMRDLEAGKRLGVEGVLVRTGKGAEVERSFDTAKRQLVRVANDLFGASQLILSSVERGSAR